MNLKIITACLLVIGILAMSSCGVLEPVDATETNGDGTATGVTSDITGGTATTDPTGTVTSQPTATAPATSDPTAEPTNDPTSDPTNVPVTSDPTDAPITSTPTTGTLTPKPDDGIRTICLDAGHGFVDGGCSSAYLNGQNEKDVTLAITMLAKEALEARGYTVILTHDGQNYAQNDEIVEKCELYGLEYNDQHRDWYSGWGVFSAYERTIYSNVLHAENDVDLFISLHVDSFTDSSVSGFSIFYCTENESTPESFKAVFAMENALESTFTSKRCRSEGFDWNNAYIVTKYTNMPSMLIEMGYATNPDDAANLLDPVWRGQFVQTIADGVDAYFG